MDGEPKKNGNKVSIKRQTKARLTQNKFKKIKIKVMIIIGNSESLNTRMVIVLKI